MTTEYFIIDLFCRIDDQMMDVKKHKQSSLYFSEVVTVAFLFALKGVGNRPFYRWLNRGCRQFFPRLSHRTRLFRLFNSHRQWTNRDGSAFQDFIEQHTPHMVVFSNADFMKKERRPANLKICQRGE